MTTRDDSPEPLPREWLPESPVPPEEDEMYWESRFQRLIAEAEPALAEIRRPPRTGLTWLEALVLHGRAALAGGLALATSAVLVLALGVGRRSAPDGRSLLLRAVASEGEPAALFGGPGVDADPTLALIALEIGADEDGGAP